MCSGGHSGREMAVLARSRRQPAGGRAWGKAARNLFDAPMPTSLIRPATGPIYAPLFDPREMGVGVEARF